MLNLSIHYAQRKFSASLLPSSFSFLALFFLLRWAFMHQSIPPAPSPPPPRADPRALAFFVSWMANSRGWGLLSCQIPRGGDEKRGQMPRPPSTLQHFSLITQSNSAILSISMCDFFVSINVLLCNSAEDSN